MKIAVLVKDLSRLFRSIFWRSRLFWLMLLASLLLSGCVSYDIGVNFDNPNQGELVQQIKLGERLTSFSNDAVKQWLNSIESRTRQLQGKIKRVSDREITVTIPFHSGAELESKFNQFFNPVGNNKLATATTEKTELPNIESQFNLKQSNLFLLVRNQLIYDLDLRSLSLISTNNNVLTGSGSIIDLKFGLNTPWGARSVEKGENAVPAQKYQNGHGLVWQLKPGEINHLEAVFWLPSPLGIGTVVIILFVAAGIYLRYKFMPDPATIQTARTAIPEN